MNLSAYLEFGNPPILEIGRPRIGFAHPRFVLSKTVNVVYSSSISPLID